MKIVGSQCVRLGVHASRMLELTTLFKGTIILIFHMRKLELRLKMLHCYTVGN